MAWLFACWHFREGAAIWRDAAICGSLLFSGYAFQTAGLVTTGATNSALITGLFVIITPLAGSPASATGARHLGGGRGGGWLSPEWSC